MRTRPKTATLGRTWWVIAVIVSIVSIACVIGAVVYQNAQPAPRHTETGPEGHVNVTGKVGATPVLTLNEPVDIDSDYVATLRVGTGRKIAEETPVLVQVHKFSGTTGGVIGKPEIRATKATTQDLGPLIAKAVIGATEGSRVLLLRQEEGYSPEIDVVDIMPTTARGEALEATTSPLNVTMTDHGPVVTHDDTAPSQVTVQTLINGRGAQISATSTVLAQYTALLWSDGTIVASTWTDGLPQTVNLNETMPGIREALTDRRVGSRLAITIPPDAADGSDTLIVIVDILGILPETTTEDNTE